ncbi:MAG TPA: serine hydrolase domain-containing protein [Actinoplanes sp.]|nr:serine hydrolase domain-containing protein [Actinoplanes sp.]
MSLLPETGRHVDEIVTRAQSGGRVPSLVLGVVRDRALAHFSGAGEQPAPDPQTQYRIGSITKTMTATMVLQLRDEGFFSLDDLLYRHLPGTSVGGITLRQLLGHVSGLQREPDGPWWERSTGGDLEKFLADLTFDKVAGPPYRSYHYSNLAYGLLGAVLQRVTGESWADLLGKRVLDPLGMKRTSYAPVQPFARGYVVHPLHQSLHEEPRLDAGAMAPAGQLWSTVTDMVQWASFLSDPATAVLSRDTVDEMCTPVVISDLESWTAGHGLGPELYRVGERVFVGHGGSMPGYVAQLIVHRPSRTGVIAFANAYGLRGSSLRAVGLEVLNTVLDAEPPSAPTWRPSAAPSGPAAELTGRWWWMGREFEVTATGDELVFTSLSTPGLPWRFVAEAPDRWRGRSGLNDGEILQVRRDEAGAVTVLDIATFLFSRDPSQLG